MTVHARMPASKIEGLYVNVYIYVVGLNFGSQKKYQFEIFKIRRTPVHISCRVLHREMQSKGVAHRFLQIFFVVSGLRVIC